MYSQKEKQVRKIAKQASGTVLNAVKVSNLEEVSDQDTDNNINVVEGEESFCVMYYKNVYS